nr:hypothetical protein CFP56_00862 [Quercus suber]
MTRHGYRIKIDDVVSTKADVQKFMSGCRMHQTTNGRSRRSIRITLFSHEARHIFVTDSIAHCQSPSEWALVGGSRTLHCGSQEMKAYGDAVQGCAAMSLFTIRLPDRPEQQAHMRQRRSSATVRPKTSLILIRGCLSEALTKIVNAHCQTDFLIQTRAPNVKARVLCFAMDEIAVEFGKVCATGYSVHVRWRYMFVKNDYDAPFCLRSRFRMEPLMWFVAVP